MTSVKSILKGLVQFWARERIETKLLHLMQTAEDSGKLQPGVAAKLYGIANFFELGVWGRIGCGGLAPIKHRQQERSAELTEELRQSFDLLRTVITTRPSHHIEIWPHAGLRFLAASDAALESPGQGTGGFLVVWHDDHRQHREAFVSLIPPLVYSLYGSLVTRRLPSWSCCKCFTLCFLGRPDFEADEVSGSSTTQQR